MTFYKIILGIIIASTNLLCLANEANKQKEPEETVLTMEEVEKLLRKITTDEHIKKSFHYHRGYYSEYRNEYAYEFRLDTSVHTKKGLEEIVKCVNNYTTDCMHPALNIETTKEVSYGDFYVDGDYDESTFKGEWFQIGEHKDEWRDYIFDCELQTQILFTHLLCYLAGKKAAIK